MKSLLFALCLIGTMVTLNAQNITVSGSVKDTAENTVPFASIIFTETTNSENRFGTLSDAEGNFSLELPKLQYHFEISIVGLQSKISEIDLRAEGSKKNLGAIIVKTNVELDEVTITSDNSAYRIELDKKVYDVSKDITASGGSLIDVMQNIPSVQVEVDGAISIRGDGNVQILVDGRLSGLTSTAAFLRTIPAGSIEKIEVITNPSSKYNSEGTGGIINVVLKKGRRKELKGSAELFSGIRINSGINLNLNQGDEKLSWYYNGGIGYSEPKSTRILILNNFDSEINDTDQSSESILEQFYVLNNLGGAWKVNSKNTFSTDVTYRIANLDNYNSIEYNDLNEGALVGISIRDNNEDDDNGFFQFRGDYELQINDQGSKLEIGLVAQSSSEETVSNIIDETLFPENELVNEDRISNTIDDRRYTISADWLHPLSENSQWEMGFRNRTTKIDNDFIVERTTEGTNFIIPEFTDATTYDENILAFYGQYAKTFEKFKFQLGLRSETTQIDINTSESNESIQYTDMFPSGFLEYGLNDENTFRLSISRRIRRPRRNALVPFSSFNDARNILIGNPSVNPTYVVLSELGYQGKFSANFSITPTLFYRSSKDKLDFFTERKPVTINGENEEVFVTTTVNIGNRESIGLEIGTSFKPLSWLNFYGEFQVTAFEQTGQFQERDFNSSGLLSGGRLNINLDVDESLKLQLQHRFLGGNETGQFRRKSTYRMDAAMSKKLFNGKGLLTLNVKDVFNTWKFNITTNGLDFTQESVIQVRTPQLNVAFSYLFNTKKYKGKKGQQYDKL